MFKKNLLVLLMLYTVSLSCLMAEKAEPFMIIDDQVQKTLELLQTTQQQTMPVATDSVTITKDKLVLALKQSGMNDEQVDFVLKRIEEFVALKSKNTKRVWSRNEKIALAALGTVIIAVIVGYICFRQNNQQAHQNNQGAQGVQNNPHQNQNNNQQLFADQQNNPARQLYDVRIQPAGGIAWDNRGLAAAAVAERAFRQEFDLNNDIRAAIDAARASVPNLRFNIDFNHQVEGRFVSRVD